MKICITGGAGMIGSALTKKLCNESHEVFIIDNLWRGKIDNIYAIEKFNIKNFYNIDLSKPDFMNDIINIFMNVDIVIHLADIVAGIEYVFNNQYDIFKINNTINSNVFSACEAASIKKIIYAGTACSFPLELQNSLTSILKETQLLPAHPESAYGWSKLIGMLELQYLTEKTKIPSTTLILHNVYGPNCDLDSKRSQVIPSLINRMINANNNDTINVWGSGEQGRAFVYVDDIVDAFYYAIEKDNLPPYIQIGPNECTSIKQLVTILNKEVIKKNLNIHYDLTKPEGDKGRSADYSLANKYLGWSPKVNINEGLTNLYKWILEYKK